MLPVLSDQRIKILILGNEGFSGLETAQVILSDNYRLNVEIEKSPILNRRDLLTFKTNIIATVAYHDLDFSFGFALTISSFSFSEHLQILSDRLLGPFDIEAVVVPIGLKISDAIMNFQNSGYEVTAKVFQDCGTPRLQKRQVPKIHQMSLNP